MISSPTTATVRRVVKEAISQHKLSESSINLVVDRPQASKFYLLPKIHKPGNPGRLVVSACNCPTELIATYLDATSTPLVKSLPSFVNDTRHISPVILWFKVEVIVTEYLSLPNDR